MADPDLLARSRTLAKLALASAVALVALILVLPLFVGHATVPGSLILLWGVFLLLAAIIVGVALAYLFMTQGLRVDTPSHVPGPGRPTDAAAPSDEPPGVPAPEVALRLLTGDERALYRRIVAAGGDLLQKELVGAGLFSGPKVTRILDRLEAKGLISRERHGMTNRIRLSEAWRGRA